jgi:hypothetical protein
MQWMRMPLSVASMMMGMAFIGVGSAAADSPSDHDWFRGQSVRPAGEAGAEANGAGRDFDQPGAQVAPPMAQNNGRQNSTGQSDFPEDSMHDWVVASARTARSRAVLHLVEKQLNDTIRDAQWTFEQSREFRDATAAEKQAYDNYIAERQKALQSVVTDPKYQSAIRLRDDLGDQIARFRAGSKPGIIPREELLALASQKLQYASDAHNMERDALDSNAVVQDARQKMVQASARTAELRAAFENSIRMNPQIAQARRNLDMARVELITAEAYYSAAAEASQLATDYSYYRHRWDGLASPVIAPGWGTGGYVAGY